MPILEAFPCWRRFGQFKSPIRGVCKLLSAFAWINVEECQANPKLRAELFARCEAALAGYQQKRGTTRLIRQADGSDRAVWIPGVLPGTGVHKLILDAKGQPEIERDRAGRPVLGPGGKPKAKSSWVPPIPPLEYIDEPADKWSSFAVLAEQFPKQTIRADCDDLSTVWAAYWRLRGKRARVGISQPRTKCCNGTGDCQRAGSVCSGDGPTCARCGFGMAHAYTVIDDGERTRWFDGSSLSGMGQPRATFYGSGETAVIWD